MLDTKRARGWIEAFIDASFAPAKKVDPLSALPKGVKERSGWWWSTASYYYRSTLASASLYLSYACAKWFCKGF